MFWPSFNAAMTSGAQQQRAVINTMLSLAAACFVVIVWSQRIRGKFKMVDIQNATLAGGVAVGATANLMIRPWGALLIGSLAGTVSVLGFAFVQAFLERTVGLYDTAGIHNLHGMPSIIGALAAIIAAAAVSTANYGSPAIIAEHFPAMGNSTLAAALQNQTYLVSQFNRTPGEQAGFQAAAMFLTFGLAGLSGLLAGGLLSLSFCDPPPSENYFDDIEFFEVPSRIVVEGAKSPSNAAIGGEKDSEELTPAAAETSESSVDVQDHHVERHGKKRESNQRAEEAVSSNTSDSPRKED